MVLLAGWVLGDSKERRNALPCSRRRKTFRPSLAWFMYLSPKPGKQKPFCSPVGESWQIKATTNDIIWPERFQDPVLALAANWVQAIQGETGRVTIVSGLPKITLPFLLSFHAETASQEHNFCHPLSFPTRLKLIAAHFLVA